MSLKSVESHVTKRSVSSSSNIDLDSPILKKKRIIPAVNSLIEEAKESEVDTYIDSLTEYYEDVAVDSMRKMRQKVIIKCIEWFTQSVLEGKENIGAVLISKGATPADVTYIKEHRLFGELLRGSRVIEEDGRLILIQLPSIEHQITVDTCKYQLYRQLKAAGPDIFTVSGNISRADEFRGRQPDVIIFPSPAYIPEFITHKDAGATRVAVEVEGNHRSVSQCRVHGMYLFNNSTLLRALVIIKVYSTSAIAVVYHRNQHTDNVEFLQAVSFGRENLSHKDIFFWTTSILSNHPVPILPPIPTRNDIESFIIPPDPNSIPLPATVKIPASDVWYQIRDAPNGVYLNTPHLMMEGQVYYYLQLNLRSIAKDLRL